MSITEDKVRELLQTRVKELNAEKGRIEKALEALRMTKAANAPKPTKTRKRSSRRKRKGKPSRIDQAISLVSKNPGISGSDIAKEMKIKPNYLYRVLGDLVKEGRLKKDGKQYYPVELSENSNDSKE